MAKAWTKATNFLKFCTCCAAGVALLVGVSGVSCAADVGKTCTGSGLFLGWAMAHGSKFMGIG